ncbi:MAG: hypothetical protein ACOYB3_01545 [Azonexus sp.]
MTRTVAKRIVLPILDRWENLPRTTLGIGLRFVVIKNRTAPQGQQDTGYMFTNRHDALVFAESNYRGDFAMFAFTERGSVDITPSS